MHMYSGFFARKKEKSIVSVMENCGTHYILLPLLDGSQTSCAESQADLFEDFLTRNRFHLAGMKLIEPAFCDRSPFRVHFGIGRVQGPQQRINDDHAFLHGQGLRTMYNFSCAWHHQPFCVVSNPFMAARMSPPTAFQSLASAWVFDRFKITSTLRDMHGFTETTVAAPFSKLEALRFSVFASNMFFFRLLSESSPATTGVSSLWRGICWIFTKKPASFHVHAMFRNPPPQNSRSHSG